MRGTILPKSPIVVAHSPDALTSLRIVLAICTCRRPGLLESTLVSIENGSRPPEDTRVEIVVADNDAEESARQVVEKFQRSSSYAVHYLCEPRSGIPFARNAAIDKALQLNADAMIFIDDDEEARPQWLITLIRRYQERNLQGCADVIQGPVFPRFIETPAENLPRDLFSTPGIGLADGQRLGTAATNNVIFSMALCREGGLRFEEKMRYSGSSDTVFFRDAVESGYRIEWCSDAALDETIPPERMNVRWLRQRQYRYGVSNVLGFRLRRAPKKTRRTYLRAWWRITQKHTPGLFSFDAVARVSACLNMMQALGIAAGLLGLRYDEYKPAGETASSADNEVSQPADISVIVPVYNAAPWLADCLESILQQSHRNIEIICVDDCSTDASVDILRRFANQDRRVRILYHDINRGISASRNSGLNASSGRYIFFVDADDRLYDSDALAHMYTIARCHEPDMVIGKTYEWIPSQNRIQEYYSSRRHHKKNNYKTSLEDNPGLASSVVVWNKLIRRSFLLKNRIFWFNENIPRFEDNSYTWKMLACAKRVSVINRPTYLFRQPESGKEYFEAKIFPHLECQILAFDEMFRFFDERSDRDPGIRTIIESRYMSALIQLANTENLLFSMDPLRRENLLLMYVRVMDRLPPASFDALPKKARTLYQHYQTGDMSLALAALK